MKRLIVTASLILTILILFSSMVFPWGSATHLYIADHIGKKHGMKNLNELYGGMACDVFNYLFLNPELALYQGYLYLKTHGLPGNESFMEVWDKTKNGLQKPLAYGFISHNDVWGADYTAHHGGLTTGFDDGYVIEKAKLLEEMFTEAWEALGLDGDAYKPLRMEYCHNIVEFNGDLILKRVDKWIGQKVYVATLFRHSSFPALLVKAYAADFSHDYNISYKEAVGIIYSAEKGFRENTLLLGEILMQDESTAIDSTAEILAELSMSYLASNGIELPPEITFDYFKYFTKQALNGAMLIMGDYMDEIEATVGFVSQGLETHNISYKQWTLHDED